MSRAISEALTPFLSEKEWMVGLMQRQNDAEGRGEIYKRWTMINEEFNTTSIIIRLLSMII